MTFKKGEIIAVVPKHDAYTEKVIINCIEYEMYSGLSIKQTVWGFSVTRFDYTGA